MNQIIRKPILITLAMMVLLLSCEVSERTETKSDDASSKTIEKESGQVETSTIEQRLKISDFIPRNSHSEAGFEQLAPKNKQLLSPGEVTFTFNTKKFPFVDGHSVRLAIENGTEKFVFDASKKITLPEGVFLCAAYLCDGNGVSIKNGKSYQLTQLNVGIDEKKNIDVKQPMVFLNLPTSREGTVVLIDFMLFNTTLSKTGDKVRLSIDDQTEIYLDVWKPLKVEGLKTGKHKILIELINANGLLYDGIYANDQFEFEVQ